MLEDYSCHVITVARMCVEYFLDTRISIYRTWTKIRKEQIAQEIQLR